MEPTVEYEAYCVKCKEKNVVMSEVEIVTMKNGRMAAKGKCPTCTTGMFRILSADQAAAL